MKYLVSIEDLILLGVDEEDAHCWFASRGKNKLTTKALKRVISEANKIGWSLPQAVNYSASKGYIGFEADWVKKDPVGFIENHTDKKWREGLDNVRNIK